MSKPIRSYPSGVQAQVIAARIKANAGGLGTLSALDAQAKRDKKT